MIGGRRQPYASRMDRLTQLAWIIGGGLAMAGIAMVGGLTIVLPMRWLDRLVLPLVALAAGTLFGGAVFHMLPEASESLGSRIAAGWLAAGFTTFLALEQFLQWHHSHRADAAAPRAGSWLILLGDGLHNFLGGLGIAATFLANPPAGITAWCAAAAHEAPQELGDFGVLVHGGWPPRRALLANLLSALTFPLGAVIAWAVARHVEVAGLAAFGAGNFLYIAASDLIPEIKADAAGGRPAVHFTLFAAGVVLMAAIATAMAP